jgi:putative endonuclease
MPQPAHLRQTSLAQMAIAPCPLRAPARQAGYRATEPSQAPPNVDGDGAAHIHKPEARVSDPRRALGRRGEELAADHLRRSGYSVVERNARTRYGEIDLVVHRHRALIFVEVKTRRIVRSQGTPRNDQAPLAGLGMRQRVHLRRLAAAWLADERRSRPFAETIRFDAIGVVIDAGGMLREVEHLENAW